MNVFSLLERREIHLLKFKETLTVIIVDYSTKYISFRNEKMQHRNDESNCLWIPDPAFWGNNDPSCASFNQFIAIGKSILHRRTSDDDRNVNIHRANNNRTNFIQLKNGNTSFNNSNNNINDNNHFNKRRENGTMVFDIIENNETFIEI